jgi:hypothetical protein
MIEVDASIPQRLEALRAVVTVNDRVRDHLRAQPSHGPIRNTVDRPMPWRPRARITGRFSRE